MKALLRTLVILEHSEKKQFLIIKLVFFIHKTVVDLHFFSRPTPIGGP